MLLIVLVLLAVVLLFGLGIAVHVLWILAAVVLGLFLLGRLVHPKRASWLKHRPW